MDLQTSINGIFDNILEREQIFVNKEVLRHSYTPLELPHRKIEIHKLAFILAPALKNETPSNILIYGKSGTGKTIVSKFICKELEKTGKKKKKPIQTIYLNCEITDTKYRVLANLAKHFKKEIPFTGWPTDKVYASFLKAVDNKKRSIVILLDEIDKLVQKDEGDILYNLTRINDDLKKARISIIGISNNLKFTDYLDARVQSSLGGEDIVFSPYNAQQLEDILKQRSEIAFQQGVVGEFVIPLCAALAARDHGDARKALDLLRVSGELAEREGSDKITEEHVRKANDKIESDTVLEASRTLPTQSKLVLYTIICLDERGGRTITTGEVYDTYKKLCKYARIDSLTQRRVSDLILELDMLGILSSKVVSKGRYGRTKEIKLDINQVQTKILLSNALKTRNISNFKLPQRKLH
jgi:cell division control protein 6